MYRKLIPAIVIFLVFSVGAFAETIVVNLKGTIYERETGQPLAGVNVSVKETNARTVSDANGAYSISAEAGQTLVFEYVGLVTREVVVTVNKSNIDIELSVDNRQLTEVTITGALGIKRSARELGASAQLVDNETLNQGKTINPLFGLTSKVAGLRINMYDSKVDPAVQITLRGTRSLQRTAGIDGRNPNAPLYVVDGIPVPDIGRINPNDIESITVL